MYSDNSYTPQVNPFTTETDGAYQFYAQNGRYDVILTKTGFTFDDDDTANLLLFDPSSSISPAQITGTQNNYAPTNGLNASVWRISSDAARTITGIAAGFAQQIITVVNVGSFSITLSNQNVGSSAANQIITGTGADLTIAASGVATLIYDSTTANWRITSNIAGSSTTTLQIPPGWLTGLALSNNALDATNDIDIAIGAASSDDAVLLNRTAMNLTSALTKRLDANWAVGTSQGMLDTGVVGNNTYHIFLIERTDTAVVDVLASLSPTAPSLPASYDKQRRIGSIYRTGGVNVAFHQFNDEFWLDTPVADVNGTIGTTNLQTQALSVPTGVAMSAITNWMVNGNMIVYVHPTTATDQAPATGAAPGTTVGAAAGPLTEASLRVPTNTSAQINFRTNSTIVTLIEITLGWVDFTRRS